MSEKKKRNAQKTLMVIFVAFVTVITFTIGYGLGRFTCGGSGMIISDDTRFSTMESVFKILTKNFYYGDDSEEYQNKLISDAINGMVDAQGDPFTDYMSPEELADFSGSLESSFVGIGVQYTGMDGNMFIISTIASSPAEAAGLLPGDLITKVDGVVCKENNLDDMAAMVAGERGSKVRLTILRGNDEFDVDVTRDVIESTVSSKIVDNIGVITISSFGTETDVELRNHLAHCVNAGVDRYVIDLRGNGGGYASTLDKMCAYFMDNGQIVMREEYRDGKEIVDEIRESKKINYSKIVILTDNNSASCSEVFTMALKENCGAVTVGLTTYGKGVAQVSKVFPDGSALKYTDVIWKSGNGVSISGVGIAPDYEVYLDDALYLPYMDLAEDETYRYDEVSSIVRNAQIRLKFLGYEPGRTDGYFSEETENAIKQFQKDNEVTVTGILDKETSVLLNTTTAKQWYLNKEVSDTQMIRAMEIVKQ